jgi:hypothetical protein
VKYTAEELGEVRKSREDHAEYERAGGEWQREAHRCAALLAALDRDEDVNTAGLTYEEIEARRDEAQRNAELMRERARLAKPVRRQAGKGGGDGGDSDA